MEEALVEYNMHFRRYGSFCVLVQPERKINHDAHIRKSNLGGVRFTISEVMLFDKSSKNSPKCILIPFTALEKCSCVLVEPERQMNHNA